jgi:hypothetical protein
MDLLDRIQCQDYNLLIEVGEIYYGWMEITLVSHYAFKKYDVSYLGDPINDLLEKFALLVEDQPYEINPFEFKLNLAVVEHPCEPENMVWLLRKKEDDLYIYIWENEYNMEEWLFADFESQYFIDDYEEVPAITKNLVFSLKGKMKDFAATLIKTIEQLKARASQNDLREEWGYKFSEATYQTVKQFNPSS